MELKTFVALDGNSKPIPSAKTYIYKRSTDELVTGLKDDKGSDLVNPFTTSDTGMAVFQVEDGSYDLQFEYNNTKGPRFAFQCVGSPVSANKLSGPTGSMLIGKLPLVSDLRSVEPTIAGQTIQVASNIPGWATMRDALKGGGQFYYDETDTTSEDDDAMVIVTAGSKRWKRVYDGNVQAEWFGVRTDGTDCRQNLLRAWRWIKRHGGTLHHPSGDINIGTGYETVGSSTARLYLQAAPEDKPFTLKGYNTRLVPEDIVPEGWQTFMPVDATVNKAYLHQMRHIAFQGTGSGINTSGVYAPTSTNCPMPKFIWDGIDYDYSKQTHRGGAYFSEVTTDASGKVTAATVAPDVNPSQTVANTFDDGARLFDIDYAMRPTIINSTFSNNFGNGIRFNKCFMQLVMDCQFNNISANQIANPINGGEATDHTGGAVFFHSCYAGGAERVSINNQRRYLRSYVKNGVETQGTLCGYIGIWFEYGIDNDTTYSSGANAFPKYVPGITEDLVATSNPLAGMQQGGYAGSCEIRGYVLGIKSENATDFTAVSCKVSDCYIPYALNGGRGRLFGCYGDEGIAANNPNPQSGFRTYAGICAFLDQNVAAFGETITMQTPRRVGCLVQGCVFVAKNIPPIYQQGSGAVWRDNTCIITGSTKIIGTGVDATAQSFGAIFDGNYFKLTSTSTPVENNFFQNSTASFLNNRFDSEQVDQVPIVLRFGANAAPMSGKGDLLFQGNKFRGNWILRADGDVNIKSIGNIFGVWSPTKAGTWNTGGSAYSYPIVINGTRPGINSVGDVIEIRSDHPTGAIYDGGLNSSFLNMSIRIVTPSTIVGTNMTRLVNIVSGCSGSRYENVVVTGNATLQMAFCTTVNGCYDIGFKGIRDDSGKTTPVGFFATTAVYGPIYMERCHWGDGTLLYKGAVQTREPNEKANISQYYKPRVGERLDYINRFTPGEAAGVMYNGTDWLEYILGAVPAAPAAT